MPVASLPVEPPLTLRVDRDGRVRSADGPLLALQREAGGAVGTRLAVPQLAAVARLCGRLGVAIERPVLAASEAEDIDLWVRAEPDPDGVTLSVLRWSTRLPARSRWAGQQDPDEQAEPAAVEDLLTDPELRLLMVSPALSHRLGGAAVDAVGQPLARLLKPIEDDDGNLPMLSALGGRVAFTGQAAHVRGSEDVVLLDGEPRFEGERFTGYAISLRSAGEGPTSLRSMPLDDLLREPLAAIISEAEEIASRSAGPLRSDYAGYGTDIAAAARHLLDMLATMAPVNATGLDDDRQAATIDLAELALDAAGLVQADATARGIMLDIGGEGRLPARGHARAITQILVNLIGNALRHSPAGGTVAILLERGELAAVTVADSGPGVAPADRRRIFERYEQGGAKGGAGLGLAISRRLAREMGGEVELLDTATGAAFRLSLPVA